MQRLAALASLPKRRGDRVSPAVFGNQCFGFGIADLADGTNEIADAVAAYGIPQAGLGLHFIAFRYGDLTHIVAESRDFQVLGFVPARGGSRPRCELFLNVWFFPVTDQNLALQTDPHGEMSELPIAVSGLI